MTEAAFKQLLERVLSLELLNEQLLTGFNFYAYCYTHHHHLLSSHRILLTNVREHTMQCAWCQFHWPGDDHHHHLVNYHIAISFAYRNRPGGLNQMLKYLHTLYLVAVSDQRKTSTLTHETSLRKGISGNVIEWNGTEYWMEWNGIKLRNGLG